LGRGRRAALPQDTLTGLRGIPPRASVRRHRHPLSVAIHISVRRSRCDLTTTEGAAMSPFLGPAFPGSGRGETEE